MPRVLRPAWHGQRLQGNDLQLLHPEQRLSWLLGRVKLTNLPRRSRNSRWNASSPNSGRRSASPRFSKAASLRPRLVVGLHSGGACRASFSSSARTRKLLRPLPALGIRSSRCPGIFTLTVVVIPDSITKHGSVVNPRGALASKSHSPLVRFCRRREPAREYPRITFRWFPHQGLAELVPPRWNRGFLTY